MRGLRQRAAPLRWRPAESTTLAPRSPSRHVEGLSAFSVPAPLIHSPQYQETSGRNRARIWERHESTRASG